MNEIEWFSGDYISGYTKAIFDIQDVFKYIQDDLIFHRKRLSHKLATELLQTILENRDGLRQDIYEEWFFRWNTKKNGFEWVRQQAGRRV